MPPYIPTVLPTVEAMDPPCVATRLPTVGAMYHPLPGYSRNPVAVRCVARVEYFHSFPGSRQKRMFLFGETILRAGPPVQIEGFMPRPTLRKLRERVQPGLGVL